MLKTRGAEQFKCVKMKFLLVLSFCIGFSHGGQDAVETCEFPSYLRGFWYYVYLGLGQSLHITVDQYRESMVCSKVYNHPKMNMQSEGANHTFLVRDKDPSGSCFYRLDILWRTQNVLQMKLGNCIPVNAPGVDKPIAEYPGITELPPSSQLRTLFRVGNPAHVGCSSPFDEQYQFTYEFSIGGGGICNKRESVISPNSSDEGKFSMHYGECPDAAGPSDNVKEYRCYGTWDALVGGKPYTFYVIANTDEVDLREKFKCLLTQKKQKNMYNEKRMIMSRFADCSRLGSIYDGPVRLVLWNECVRDLMDEAGHIECLDNFSSLFYNMGSAQHSLGFYPIYSNEPWMELLCSDEGKAAGNCMMGYFERCPSLGEGFYNLIGINTTEIKKLGGVNKTCQIFQGMCKNGNECYSKDILDKLESSSMAISEEITTDYSPFYEESQFLCGPLKTMYDCIYESMKACNLKKEEMIALFEIYGSTPEYRVTPHTCTLISERCTTEEKDFVNSTCVTKELTSIEFTGCVNNASVKYPMDKCRLYSAQVDCIKEFVGEECGEESSKFLTRNILMMDQTIPSSCLVETSASIKNEPLVLFSACIVLLLTLYY